MQKVTNVLIILVAAAVTGSIVCSVLYVTTDAIQIGTPGSPGYDGAPGLPGEKGDTGPPGENGLNGTMGTQGPPGPNGAVGPDGLNGTVGPNGTAGASGTAVTFRQMSYLGITTRGMTANSWNARELALHGLGNLLNTYVQSVSSTQWRFLIAGRYYFRAFARNYLTGFNQLRLRDVTNSNILLVGMSGRAVSTSESVVEIAGVINGTANAIFQLEHNCQFTRSGDGTGAVKPTGVPSLSTRSYGHFQLYFLS